MFSWFLLPGLPLRNKSSVRRIGGGGTLLPTPYESRREIETNVAFSVQEGGVEVYTSTYG